MNKRFLFYLFFLSVQFPSLQLSGMNRHQDSIHPSISTKSIDENARKYLDIGDALIKQSHNAKYFDKKEALIQEAVNYYSQAYQANSQQNLLNRHEQSYIEQDRDSMKIYIRLLETYYEALFKLKDIHAQYPNLKFIHTIQQSEPIAVASPKTQIREIIKSTDNVGSKIQIASPARSKPSDHVTKTHLKMEDPLIEMKRSKVQTVKSTGTAIRSEQNLQLSNQQASCKSSKAPSSSDPTSESPKTHLEMGDMLIEKSKNELNSDEKKSLIQQAANNYEHVYRIEKTDPTLHCTARIKLERIYALHPTLKIKRTLQLFEQEDKQLVNAMPSSSPSNFEIQKNSDDEKFLDKYFKSSDNRAAFSARVFANDILRVQFEKEIKEQEALQKAKKEKIAKERAAQKALAKEKAAKLATKKEKNNIAIDELLLQSATEHSKKKEFADAAQLLWQVLETSENNKLKEKARQEMQLLHDSNKSQEATYYLVRLADNAKKKIDLFLQAENRRDILKEKEKAKALEQEAEHIEEMNEKGNEVINTATSNAMMEAQKEINALAQTGKHPRALHALAIHFCHQASVFPATQVSALRSAAACAKQLHDGGKSFEEGYSYPLIVNYLGVALHDRAKRINASKTNPTRAPFVKRDIDEAERFLQISSDLNNVFGHNSLAIIQEWRFRNLKEPNKLDEALSSYIMALKKGSADACTHIEKLLLEGIDSIPLSIPQRNLLINALKEKSKSDLFEKKDFKDSRYFAEANKSKQDGSLEFYEGLYYFDRKEYTRALALLTKAQDKSFPPACTFMFDAAISTDLRGEGDQALLKGVEMAWKIIPKLKYPAGPILLSSTITALNKLVTQGNIEGIYTCLKGHLSSILPYKHDSIKKVCELLDKAEDCLKQNPNNAAHSKLFEDDFIRNVLDFAKKTQSPAPLYTAADHALTRLQQSTTSAQTLGALKLLSAITESFDVDLRKQKHSYVPCAQSSTNLIAKIEQILNSNTEKEYSPSLKALRSVLQGIPQKSEQNIRQLSSSLTVLYQLQIKRTGLAMKANNNAEIIASLRSLIGQFRMHGMQEKYRSLRQGIDLMTNLAAYTAAKGKMKDESDLFSCMGLNLVLIADKYLTEPDYPLEKAFEQFCSAFPLGSAILARELVANVLFAPDKAKARDYIKRAREEAAKAGQMSEEMVFINDVEKMIDASPVK